MLVWKEVKAKSKSEYKVCVLNVWTGGRDRYRVCLPVKDRGRPKVTIASTVYIENVKSMLWSLVGVPEREYGERLHTVHYVMFTYINRQLVRDSLQTFVLDIFNSPDTTQSVLSRAHDIYHGLLM